jgi:hypothetical protein
MKDLFENAAKPIFKATRENLEHFAEVAKGWTHKNPPPIGTKCKYSLNGANSWWDCEIISHNRLVILCPHLKMDGDSGLQIVGETNTVRFKPNKPAISKDAKEQLEIYVQYRIDKYGDYETKKDLLDYLSHHDITD